MRFLVTAALLALSILPAHSEGQSFGSFYIDPKEPRLLVLAGPIQQNAPIDLRRALRAFPAIDTMALHSDGGDVTAALLIAQEVFDSRIDTMIAPDSYCFSACAYIFFAGRNRSLHGKLGVHQMANEAGDTYSIQLSISDMLDTMAEFEVPPSVISDMLRTAPDDMRIYTAADAPALNRGTVSLIASAAPDAGSDEPMTFDLPAATQPTAPEGLAFGAAEEVTPSQAMLFVASADADTSADQMTGTVWWSQGTEDDGRPFVIAEVSVPGADYFMDAKVRLRDVNDATLAAEFMIEADFSFSGAGALDRVEAMPGILTKSKLLTIGKALVGASAKVSEGRFVFAGSSKEPDATENLVALREPYIDVAVTLASGRNAILTLELDGNSAQLIQHTIEAWAE